MKMCGNFHPTIIITGLTVRWARLYRLLNLFTRFTYIRMYTYNDAKKINCNSRLFSHICFSFRHFLREFTYLYTYSVYRICICLLTPTIFCCWVILLTQFIVECYCITTQRAIVTGLTHWSQAKKMAFLLLSFFLSCQKGISVICLIYICQT